jgi:hypothetical protein
MDNLMINQRTPRAGCFQNPAIAWAIKTMFFDGKGQIGIYPADDEPDAWLVRLPPGPIAWVCTVV